MFSTSDTIVAIATAPGRAGIGVVRVSGPDAERIVCVLTRRTTPFEPRHATFARFATNDHVVVTLFPGPHSYTGETVAEISAHGSPVVLSAIVRAAVDAGARMAEPGEFTLRAFLSNKIDLIQAEAVADLIDAVTPLQARAAFDQLEGTLTRTIAEIERELFDVIAKLEASLDFPDEGYHFVAPREARASLAGLIARIDAVAGASVARPSRARRRPGGHRRRAERRQVEPLQCALEHQPRHRHGDTRDDARSPDRACGHRRTVAVAGRHGRRARHGGRRGTRGRLARARHAPRRRPGDRRPRSIAATVVRRSARARDNGRRSVVWWSGTSRTSSQRLDAPDAPDALDLSAKTGEGVEQADRSDCGHARMRASRCATARRSPTCVTSSFSNAPAHRSTAPPQRSRARCRRNSRCSISRKPRTRCRRSPVNARATICCVTSSNASVSVSNRRDTADRRSDAAER